MSGSPWAVLHRAIDGADACSNSDAVASTRAAACRFRTGRARAAALRGTGTFVEHRVVAGLPRSWRPRTAATAGRPSSASGCRARSAGATSAARRPRRTAATRRGADVRATQVRPRVDQREHVLQLIAEAEGAAGLIRAAARPDAAGKRLVQQPAIHDQVERIVGRVDLIAPSVSSHCARPRRALDCACAATSSARQLERMRAVAPWPSTNATLRDSPGSIADDLQRGAGIEPGAGAPGEPFSRKSAPARSASGCVR